MRTTHAPHRPRLPLFRVAAGASALLGAVPALAQQSNPEQTGGWYRWDGGPPKLWSLQVEPSFFYVAPSGDLRMPGTRSGGGEINVTDLNIDDPDLAFMGEIHVRKDRWRLSGGGFTLNIQGGATLEEDVTFGDAIGFAGERIETTLDFTTFELVGAYRFAEYAASQRYDGVYKFVTGVEVVGGVRYFDVDVEMDIDLSTRQTVFLLPSSANADRIFAHPVVGLRWDMEFWEQASIEVESTVGGFAASDHESISWDIKAQFTWRPVEHVGAFVGYRQLAFHLEDGSSPDRFQWDGALAGLFAGVQIRF